jgi:hypothetical protein
MTEDSQPDSPRLPQAPEPNPVVEPLPTGPDPALVNIIERGREPTPLDRER